MLGGLLEALPLVDAEIPPGIAARIVTHIQLTTSTLRHRGLEQALEAAGWSLEGGAFAPGGLRNPTALREVVEAVLAEREVVVEAQKVENVFDDANESDKAVSRGQFDAVALQADPRCGAIKVCPPPHLGRLRKECRNMISPTARKGFPGQQPVSLAKENIEAVRDEDYLMSWKADGTRYWVPPTSTGVGTCECGRGEGGVSGGCLCFHSHARAHARQVLADDLPRQRVSDWP